MEKFSEQAGMLTSLSISDIVLIDRLTLDGQAGLCVLTGETGAGKSILLDALGLALGGRADAGLIRHGAEQASVSAAFDIPPSHPLHAFLDARGLSAKDGLILRRVLGKDGRSKAFINDAPVSVQLLKETGAALVEIHGQFETQGLLDPATHGSLLDAFVGLEGDVATLRMLWQDWTTAAERLSQAKADIESVRLQEEYLKYAVAELEKLDPRAGEEAALAEKRQILRAREKMADAFAQASLILDGDAGVRSLLDRLDGVLSRLNIAGEGFAPVSSALTRVRSEAEDLSWQVEKLKSGDRGEESLSDIEERYFALKECAKKHRCAPDDLPRILEDLSQKLRLITHQDDALAELEKNVAAARKKFTDLAKTVSARRKDAAARLEKAVNAELPDLRLEKARFNIQVLPLGDEREWGPAGMDRVQFLAAMNPGQPPGPVHKAASGGELSRLMLALKVILAETGFVPTLIFDEADSGIGGATADAVGARLYRLARKYQVLAVTHSPQVAARAAHHWRVSKSAAKNVVRTEISPLATKTARAEEIARMLSGAEITREARAQAAKLLEAKDAAA